jgi:hypothetical protein
MNDLWCQGKSHVGGRSSWQAKSASYNWTWTHGKQDSLQNFSFDIFFKLYHDMTISNGWYDLHRKDCTNLLCKDLELLLLGVLYTLATGACFPFVCVHTNWHVHRKFFIYWTSKFAEKKDSVVSNHRRKILSISYLHPGTRNDKHIVKFDAAVSNLHDRNSFLGRQEWNVLTVDSSISCTGYYFICVGGYLQWPVLIYPIKYGNEHGKERACGMMVESVRKEIECTFGILKSWWLFIMN